jgi:cardiolipin synthase
MFREEAWKFYTTSSDAWAAMLADCEAAERTIDLEQYLFVNDSIGKRFADVLMRKARAGVRVRVLLDSGGSFGVFVSNLPGEMQAAGVEVRFFNPISPWRVSNVLSWYFRDHRKIIVVDGKIGHVGGVCIEDIMADWRDTQLRIEDPAVMEMEEAFERMWSYVAMGGKRNFPKPASKSNDFSFLTNSPRLRQRFVYWALINIIRGATSHVYLTSPYFIPDPRFFRALRAAPRRGVDVRLLVSGPSDHPFVDIASNSYYQRAFRAGIRIFRYESRRLHAKTAVVDGRWATVGTTNLDNLSLLFNYEGNITTTNDKMISELSDQFHEDLKHAHEVSRKEWRQRPRLQKFLEKVMWPFHRFL